MKGRMTAALLLEEAQALLDEMGSPAVQVLGWRRLAAEVACPDTRELELLPQARTAVPA